MKQLGPLSTTIDREMLTIVGSYLEGMRSPQRGAPRREDRFQSFLEGIFYFTYGLGGDAHFSRALPGERPTGNVVDLLEELRPIMPTNPTHFIPKALPEAKIERVKSRTRLWLRGMANPREIADRIERLRAERGLPWHEGVCPYCEQPLHWRFPLFRPI